MNGPSGTTAFAYDDAGRRVMKRGEMGETVYVNQLYVVRNGAIATKHVFAGITRVASKLMPGESQGRGGAKWRAIAPNFCGEKQVAELPAGMGGD